MFAPIAEGAGAGRRHESIVAGCDRVRIVDGLYGRLVVVMHEGAELTIELDALEVLLHYEVDDASRGVGAINGGGTAGHDIDALDHCRRNLVQVGRRIRVFGVRIAGAQAPAVDQHQRSLWPEAAQVGSRHAAGAGQRIVVVAQVGRRSDDVLRQRVQHLDGVSLTLQAHVLGRHGSDRAGGRQVGRHRDTGTRNDDFGELARASVVGRRSVGGGGWRPNHAAQEATIEQGRSVPQPPHVVGSHS
jgi:hypothetical protein